MRFPAGRRKVACWFDGERFHCISVPARMSDRRFAAVVEQERERVADATHCWATLTFLAALHTECYGDPPVAFRPDDGPLEPPPLVRRILWVVWRNPLAQETWDRLEQLLK